LDSYRRAFFEWGDCISIEAELRWLVNLSPNGGFVNNWLFTVYHAVQTTNQYYPYLSYGTDWLAFAHIMLAVLFAGALRDPQRNIWIIEFGIIAALAIFPLAFIAGSIRGIPIFWRLIDCSFGIVTLTLLLPCYNMIKKLNRLKSLF
jgi:hypothetical protein